MNILMLNASPRRGGNIDRMLSAMRQEAQKRGAEVTYFRLDELQYAPCRGCMACRSRRHCVMPTDDAPAVLQALQQCQLLIVGAPCYWSSMPGTLKILFDRMVYGMMGENRYGMPRPLLRGVKCMVVSTSTTPFPLNLLLGQTWGVVTSLRKIFRWSGIRIIKVFQYGGTRQHSLTALQIQQGRHYLRRYISRHS